MTPDLMTPDLTLELTLELARVSREPRAEDRRRVLEAVRRRMQRGSGAYAVLRDEGREGSGVYAVAPRHGLLGVRRPWGRRQWLDRAWRAPALRGRAALPQLVCVSVAMGALGFWLGSQAAIDAGSRELLHRLAPACH
jgi:hypothetical protein